MRQPRLSHLLKLTDLELLLYFVFELLITSITFLFFVCIGFVLEYLESECLTVNLLARIRLLVESSVMKRLCRLCLSEKLSPVRFAKDNNCLL